MASEPLSLTQYPIPRLIQSQIDAFTLASIHAVEVAKLDVASVATVLAQKEGTRVIGADFGGDKGATRVFVVRGGRLEIDEAYEDYVQSTHGAGYLVSMERTAAFAATENLPIGVSWGTPLRDTTPLFHAKASEFIDELQERYDGDLANVMPTLTACINDGPAGLISGAVAAARHGAVDTVLFPINGGGLGMAVLADGTLYATEAGHVRANDELNTYGQTAPCGVFGADFVCLESLGANKVGIEVQWAQRYEPMRAIDIEAEYKAGNAFAGELYDHSALVVAHVIAGTANAFDIDLSNEQTAVVGHGGGFKFPHYGERVAQILARYTGDAPRLMTSSSYGDARSNACLEGAALAALLKV